MVEGECERRSMNQKTVKILQGRREGGVKGDDSCGSVEEVSTEVTTKDLPDREGECPENWEPEEGEPEEEPSGPVARTGGD